MKFPITNRFTGRVQFVAEIDCAEDTPTSVKLGLAVKWAVKNGAKLTGAKLTGADLGGAYLTDADLRGADLRGADLRGACLGGAYLTDADLANANLTKANLAYADHLIDGGQRMDGYRFVGWIKDGVLQIRAGCRNFTITDARAHWASPDYRDSDLGDEALAILDRIETTARIRGLVYKGEG